MEKMSTIEEILEFAINEEEGAFRFYTDLSKRVEKEYVKNLLLEFANEELGHKEKLLNIKKSKFIAFEETKVMDLKIADYIVDITPSADIDYQEALILAMQKEKAAFRMYSDLAKKAKDKDTQMMFKMLAQEEAQHKLRFEIEYDENVLSEA